MRRRFLPFAILPLLTILPSPELEAQNGAPRHPMQPAVAAQAARRGGSVEKGAFLVAERSLLDPNFAESVVLITGHGSWGSIGVVINRPTRTPLSQAFPTINEFEKRPERLFSGGPVQREVMIYLLRTEAPPESATPLFEKVYAAPVVDTIRKLISRGAPSDRFRIYSGYAGWAPGQLEREIGRGDWRVIPADADLLFRDDPSSVWEEMLRRASQQTVQIGEETAAPS